MVLLMNQLISQGDNNIRNLVQFAVDDTKQKKVVFPFRSDQGFFQALEIRHRFYLSYSLFLKIRGLSRIKGLVLGLS